MGELDKLIIHNYTVMYARIAQVVEHNPDTVVVGSASLSASTKTRKTILGYGGNAWEGKVEAHNLNTATVTRHAKQVELSLVLVVL